MPSDNRVCPECGSDIVVQTTARDGVEVVTFDRCLACRHDFGQRPAEGDSVVLLEAFETLAERPVVGVLRHSAARDLLLTTWEPNEVAIAARLLAEVSAPVVSLDSFSRVRHRVLESPVPDGVVDRRCNPKCAVAAAGGRHCDVDGGDPAQRCGPCRSFLQPHGYRHLTRKV